MSLGACREVLNSPLYAPRLSPTGIVLTPTIAALNIAKNLSLSHLLIALALLATTLRLIAILRPKNKTNTA